ncbi:MAG: right-handed parallel beta-helix repeat-containing protein, partial [Anaerolineales bacterium]|nr:right-handed parallel beta-helix repeat-containing protein [Anaerolineales bacterium]
MTKTIRAFFLSLTILAFLLFSTVGTTVVYADDGSGTPETETTPTPPDEGQPAETEAGDETPVAEGEQPSDEETQPVEETASEGETPVAEGEQPSAEETQPVEEPVAEETLQTILEQVPENTTVTVLNSEGEALPLVSQESANAIASAYDPIWCPAGQVPTPGENGCTQSFSSFDELLAFLQANEGDAAYQQNGTIYIQQGAYLGGETSIDFNNYAFTQFNTFDLTLQGGWDTTYDPDVDGAPTFTTGTQFNVPIIIGSSSNPWAGSLTINNISISNVSGQTGLTLYTDGNINLDQVEVTNSQSGAYLDAGGFVAIEDSSFSANKEGGANIIADGHVNILNSNFDNNGSKRTDGYGVRIQSGDEVNLSNMSASFNEIFGADVTAEGPVYIDASQFNGNLSYQYGTITGGYGLSVVSQGDITVDQGAVPGEGIEANGNYFFGAYLEGVNVYVAQSAFNNNGSGNVENPIGRGLEVVSTGTVALISLAANNNQLFGANVEVKGAGAVTVTNSVF